MNKTQRLVLILLLALTAHVQWSVTAEEKEEEEDAVTEADLGTCPAGSEDCDASASVPMTELDPTKEGAFKLEWETLPPEVELDPKNDTQGPKAHYENGTISFKLDLTDVCHFGSLFKTDEEIVKMNMQMSDNEKEGYRDKDMCCETLSLHEKMVGVKWDIDGRPWHVPSITVNGVEKFQVAQTGNCLPDGNKGCKKGICFNEFRVVPLLAMKAEPDSLQFRLFGVKAYCSCKTKVIQP